MAGDWLKVEVATPDKPEIWLIAEELQIDPDAVVGKLLRVDKISGSIIDFIMNICLLGKSPFKYF